MSDRIKLSIKDGVADVRLNRPDKLNALDPEMFAALAAAGERLKTEPGVRAVTLTGEGRAFCAGLDVESFQSMAGGSDPEIVARMLAERSPGGANPWQQAVMVWRELPVPVIAGVHGVAFGGGLQIALGCDLRFVGAETRLSIMELAWGIIPDMGGIGLMRGLVRDDILRALVWTARTVTGDEAMELGLATQSCQDPWGEALTAAEQIAAMSPQAIRASKRLLNLAADADTATILAAEAREQAALMGSPDQIEAVRANLEKRAPVFKG
jgi:enoyl-CoA hydratase/carnithine racemase